MATNLPRREFLQQLSGTATGLALMSPLTAFAFVNRQKGETEDVLSFTQLEGLGPHINAQFINQNHVALHGEHHMADHMINASHNMYAEQLLRESVSKQGGQWDEEDSLLWTYQHYGRCDHTKHCYRLLGYCMTAQDYLYNTVNGLLDIKMNWHVLTEDIGDRIKSQNNFSGFVGRYTYLIHRVNLLTKEGNIKDYGLISATPVNRAINFITSEKDDVPNTSLMYIIPGTTSLMSPFSELLHLTTHGPSKRFARELEATHDRQQAEETSRLISETITESAAILIAQKYLKQHHHDDRIKVVNAHARNLGRQYSLIPRTVSYMARYGVQHALDTFASDPLYLVNRINSAHNNTKHVQLK